MMDDSSESVLLHRESLFEKYSDNYNPAEEKQVRITIKTRSMNQDELNKMFVTKYIKFIPNSEQQQTTEVVKKYIDVLPEDTYGFAGFFITKVGGLYKPSIYTPENDFGYVVANNEVLKTVRESDRRSLMYNQCDQLCMVLNNSKNVIHSDTSIPELNIVAGEWMVLHHDKMLDRLTRELTSIGFEPKFV